MHVMAVGEMPLRGDDGDASAPATDRLPGEVQRRCWQLLLGHWPRIGPLDLPAPHLQQQKTQTGEGWSPARGGKSPASTHKAVPGRSGYC